MLDIIKQLNGFRCNFIADSRAVFLIVLQLTNLSNQKGSDYKVLSVMDCLNIATTSSLEIYLQNENLEQKVNHRAMYILQEFHLFDARNDKSNEVRQIPF